MPMPAEVASLFLRRLEKSQAFSWWWLENLRFFLLKQEGLCFFLNIKFAPEKWMVEKWQFPFGAFLGLFQVLLWMELKSCTSYRSVVYPVILPGFSPPGMYPKPCKSWDFNYLSLNWWVSPDFWLNHPTVKRCVWPGAGAYHVRIVAFNAETGALRYVVIDGGKVCFSAAADRFSWKKHPGFEKDPILEIFFVKMLESWISEKKSVSTFQMDWFHTGIVSEFFGECVRVCLSFFGTGCISRHWQFRSSAASEWLGS